MIKEKTVAIITGKLAFQKYFCVEMARRQNVIAVIHPGGGAIRTESKAQRLRRKIKQRGILRLIPNQVLARPYIAASRKHGAIPHLLHHLGRTGKSKYLGWNRERATQAADREYFAGASTQFDQLLADVATTVPDINSDETVAMLSDLNPDVAICLGGPLYRQPLIDSCRLMLNYHTGISPIYNGTGAIYWCFANGHVHLSGATLMVIGHKIDGGDILGHYLPSIESADDPARLFAKCIVGSVSMYHNFLNWYWANKSFTSVVQCEPLFYYRGFHWNVTQNFSIERILKSGAVEKYKREESVFDYWRERTNQDAEIVLKDRMTSLLFRDEYREGPTRRRSQPGDLSETTGDGPQNRPQSPDNRPDIPDSRGP